HAIVAELDDWGVAADERKAMQAQLATPWKRNGTFVAIAFFGLTVFALFAIYALCGGYVAAAVEIAFAEYLIRRRRMYGSGIESALWIGALLSVIAALPRSGDPEAMLVIAAAFGIAAWRMQSPFFGAIGAVFAAAYPAVADHTHSYWHAALL